MNVITGVRRFDYGKIKEIKRTPQGFLLVPGYATRVGVFPYLDASGEMRRELRHPDDVFAPESLTTLKYAPVTIEHPPEMITPENVDKYTKGHCTERVEVNRDMVETDLIIEHQDAIDEVEKNNLRDLSCGYLADVEEEEGEYNGAPYNFRQKNIRYNHLAIVRRGRAGPEVRLRMDSQDAIMDEQEISKPGRSEYATETSVADQDEGKTKNVIISGKEVALPSAEADIVQEMLDRYDEMRAKLMKMEEEMQAKRTDKTDVDISQPGVSPQVKVEQGAPDGRKAPAKIGASDTGGAARAKGDDDVDARGVIGGATPLGKADDEPDKAKDDDDEPKKDFEGAPGGVAMSPVDLLKKDMDELQARHDELKAKLDAMANPGLAQGEAKPDRMDAKDAIRARVKLERQAEKLVPSEIAAKFDSMSDDAIRTAVIKNRRPKADLVGKSSVYLQSRFDGIVEAEEDEGGAVRREMGKALLGGRMDGKEQLNPDQSRQASIEASRNMWKENLSAVKK